MTKKKALEWAYMDSPNADECGFELGCWVIEITQPDRGPELVAGFDDAHKAIAFAEQMPHEWSSYSRHTEFQS